MLYGEVKEIACKVKNPPKEAAIRLPTTDEWLEYLRGQKQIRRDLGQRKSTLESMRNPQRALEMFKMIQTAGPEFDEFEAEHFLNVLADYNIQRAESSGGNYSIAFTWRYGRDLNGECVHRLKIPTLRQVRDYQRNAFDIIHLPHGAQEWKTNIDFTHGLWKDLIVETTGYATGFEVPPIHRGPIVGELITAASGGEDEDDPALF